MCRSLVFVFAALLLLAVPAHAGDEPTIEELARMVLRGTDAEQAMVARWLENADRDKLLALFRAVRGLRDQPRKTGVPDVLERAETQALVNMEVRFIDVPVDKLDLLLGPKRPTADATSRLMDAAAVERLLRNIEATPGAKVVSAPRLTTYDKQKANVQVTNQVSYIQDYDVETGPGGKKVADPVVGIVQEGITLELRAEFAADRKSATVDFHGTWAVLQKPIKEKKITVGGQELTIQLPEVDVAKTEASLRLSDGGHVLIGGGVEFEVDGARVERVALLHVKFFEMDAGELRDLEKELEKGLDPELEKPLIELKTDVLFVRSEHARALLGERAAGETHAHWLDAKEAAQLLDRARADPAVEIVSSSRLTAMNGKPADVELLTQVAYVREYEVEEKDDKKFLSPVVDTIQEGLVLEMRPTLAEKGFAVLEISGTHAALDRPIPTLEKTYEGRKVVIQVPELAVVRARATVKIKDGGYVLFRGPTPRFAKGAHVVLVRLKIGTVGEFMFGGGPRAAPRVKKR